MHHLLGFVRASLVLFVIVSTLGLSANAFSQTSDLDFLPKNQDYNPDIPTPEDVFGYPIGTWHMRHDQLLTYMQVLSEKSERVNVSVIGKTHEHRSLISVRITSPENQSNIDQLQAEHLQSIHSGESAKSDAPLVIYMGYSVHGNEPSGSNGSMLVAYHLAASNSDEVKDLLAQNIILLDPSLNPDGMARFAQWANMHKSKNLVSDPSNREHKEYWPSGRTNHYWFDLNRDWLLLTHPESQARIELYHAWRPHIVTDFHEMGTDSTFFFQPGIAARKNPWTPNQNVTLTAAIAKFHAKALDDAKKLYFSEESFDDFYYGKGSTYPDAHGSIGILFEQASSRGHVQESINGLLTFQDSIQNQVTTSLSTFAGAFANKAAILAYQREFFEDTKKLVADDKFAGYVVTSGKDKSRFERMVSILQSHKIKLEMLSEDIDINGTQYKAKHSIYIPFEQAQYRLIRSLFSERKRFTDNTFYDVSNWNIGLAFNLPYEEVKSSLSRKLSLSKWQTSPNQNVAMDSDAYAYAFEWFDSSAPALLQSLLDKGIQARVAGSEFTAMTSSGEVKFARGSVIIPNALTQPNNVATIVSNNANKFNIRAYNIQSGLTSSGSDLGSRSLAPVTSPKVLLIGGIGTSSYEVGEIWHYLDTRVGLPVTIWDMRDLNNRDVDRYTHIFFASGSYTKITDSTINKLEKWMNKGGVMVGQKSAVAWFARLGWINNQPLSGEAINSSFLTDGLKFADKQALGAKKLIAGAVYKSKIDLTHPLFFGYERDILPTFKTSNGVLRATDNPFEDIGTYVENPLVAGYSADEMQALIKRSASVVVNKKQKGAVIGFVDNVHFRGYWDGTNKLSANALYQTPLL